MYREFTKRVPEMSSQLFVCRGMDSVINSWEDTGPLPNPFLEFPCIYVTMSTNWINYSEILGSYFFIQIQYQFNFGKFGDLDWKNIFHICHISHMTPVAPLQHRAGAGPNKSSSSRSWNWDSINVIRTLTSDIKTL